MVTTSANRVFHITAPYVKPNALHQIHPDLNFEASKQALEPFIKKRRVTDDKRDPAATFFATSQVAQLRGYFRTLQRPPPQHIDGNLELFVVDVVETQCWGNQRPNFVSSKCQISNLNMWPVIQIFGNCLNDGSSVSMRVWGFFPYIVLECPHGFEKDPKNCSKLENYFESNLQGNKDVAKKVTSVELIDGESLMEFIPDKPKKFFKISFASTRFVGSSRHLIESVIRIDNHIFNSTPFEASVPFPLRWMIDADVVGCGCLKVPIRGVHDVPTQYRTTRCQREVDVWYGDIQSIPCVGEYSSIPKNVRVLALDIECVTVASAGFPVPEKDPVIQISSILKCIGEDAPTAKVVFTLNTCTAIPNAIVISFEDEKAMLSCWREFVIYCDPDFLSGYNFINFDLNYLVSRSMTLDLPNFRNLGRVINIETKIRDQTLSTKALGTHENKDINIEGRIQFDVLEMIRREYKLKSYSLNAVSAHFLKEQKEDVHYSQIGDLQRANADTRQRIAIYCLKDSALVLRLLDTLCFLVNYMEMARVTGVPVNLLLTRGQQIKVTSQLMRKSKDMGHFMPTLRTQGGGTEVQYEGATVLDPLKDFYDIPIATLDFASLYPSIMIAHNLCYSTLVSESNMQKFGLKEDDVFRTPAGKIFVKSHVKKGILPTIVGDLIRERKKAKKEMATTADAMLKMVLDGRQLALKISANSVYGYTGASATGQLPCLAISESITAYGRSMIDFTKKTVESIFTKANGYDHDSIVVYGDTDSVMVKFGTSDVADTMKLGREAARIVSEKFISPIALEFEKVFFPFLLMNKKRYAGLMWTKPDTWNKIDCKGIETVRRDFCMLVQRMVDDALKLLLIDRDVEGAKRITRQRIQDLLMNRIDMSYLVLSKSLGKEDYASKLAHVELAKKLRKRDPAKAPQIGDRVYYVVVAGAKGQAQYERAEDPLYVLENNIPIDVDFYLDSIKNPIIRIFEPIEKQNVESLFTGEHTRQRKVIMPTTGAMAKFVTTGLRCLSCRGVIKQGAFCDRCRKTKKKETMMRHFYDFREKEKEYHALWTTCQRCQESLHADVICTSRDCPIFYRRTKAKKETESMLSGPIKRLIEEPAV